VSATALRLKLAGIGVEDAEEDAPSEMIVTTHSSDDQAGGTSMGIEVPSATSEGSGAFQMRSISVEESGATEAAPASLGAQPAFDSKKAKMDYFARVSVTRVWASGQRMCVPCLLYASADVWLLLVVLLNGGAGLHGDHRVPVRGRQEGS